MRLEDLSPELKEKALACKTNGHMKGCRAGRKSYTVLTADFLCRHLFHYIDVLTDRADPVRQDRFIHPAALIPVHGRRTEPDPGRKRFNSRKARISIKILFSVVIDNRDSSGSRIVYSRFLCYTVMIHDAVFSQFI